MKTLLVLALAMFSLGFIIEVQLTPEQKRARAAQEKAWHDTLVEQFDLTALQAFLQGEIARCKTCDGVDLTRSKLAPTWTVEGKIITCGDWCFQIKKVTDDEFRLVWNYEYIPPGETGDGLQKSVAFECMRQNRSVFKMVRLHRYENEVIILNP